MSTIEIIVAVVVSDVILAAGFLFNRHANATIWVPTWDCHIAMAYCHIETAHAWKAIVPVDWQPRWHPRWDELIDREWVRINELTVQRDKLLRRSWPFTPDRSNQYKGDS